MNRIRNAELKNPLRPPGFKRILSEEILPRVNRPARYIGGEVNSALPANPEVRLLLSYPDVYEVGMSHLGLRILYDLVNRMGWAAAERAFAFGPDMEKLCRRAGIGIYSLETFTPAAEFDVWGFSLQAELTYTNLLNMIDLAGLPRRARDRDLRRHPLLLGGGAAVYNPEPLAEFFDLFLVGDAEESLPELLSALRSLGKERKSVGREEFLAALVERVKGLYAPALYRPRYDRSGRFREIVPLNPNVPPVIEKRVLGNLDRSGVVRPLVPLTEIVHDRDVVEIMRGCPRRCRFCQAGWTSRPVRRKAGGVVISQALALNRASGHREVSLLSLSSGDWRGIESLLEDLSARLAPEQVSLSLPSLNINSFEPAFLAGLKKVRKSGLTLAPEAASLRLQKLINKPLEVGRIEKIALESHRRGWRLLKLYFMVGLPTETEEDVLEIASYINRLSRWGGGLNVTISNFVPKAATPFQWADFLPPSELERRHLLIKRSVPGGKVKLKIRQSFVSLIEAIIARGDRRAGDLIEEAWKLGCRFDDWSEYFQPSAWKEALERSGIQPSACFSFPYEPGDNLPWSHIGSGVTDKVLAGEWGRALKNAAGGAG